jgi:hypothetical protein
MRFAQLCKINGKRTGGGGIGCRRRSNARGGPGHASEPSDRPSRTVAAGPAFANPTSGVWVWPRNPSQSVAGAGCLSRATRPDCKYRALDHAAAPSFGLDNRGRQPFKAIAKLVKCLMENARAHPAAIQAYPSNYTLVYLEGAISREPALSSHPGCPPFGLDRQEISPASFA